VLYDASDARTVLSTPKRRRIGWAQWWSGAHRNPFTIKRGSDIFRLVPLQNERNDAGFVGRGADETQSWNFFQEPRCVVQEFVFVLGDGIDADPVEIVDGGAQSNRIRNMPVPASKRTGAS
jgi:hypothetical protein